MMESKQCMKNWEKHIWSESCIGEMTIKIMMLFANLHSAVTMGMALVGLAP